ncbi:hypothetical protein WISP_127510 [Willisornis vidua]|uniref:Uncharacterized protein n=1 Tax=Willisornis vidua TaxID=1566151 RepID=A0ABQ9CQN8_9PASS|nr:hypothetical protein WISP_127510 [Willisornis vidua]
MEMMMGMMMEIMLGMMVGMMVGMKMLRMMMGMMIEDDDDGDDLWDDAGDDAGDNDGDDDDGGDDDGERTICAGLGGGLCPPAFVIFGPPGLARGSWQWQNQELGEVPAHGWASAEFGVPAWGTAALKGPLRPSEP